MSSSTIGPIEIAKLHAEIFSCLAHGARRHFVPVLATVAIFAVYLRPGVTPLRALTEVGLALAINLPLHLGVAVCAVPILVGLTALVGWRQVLAIGSPEALVALLRAARGRSTSILIDLAVAAASVLVRERRIETQSLRTTIDQLRASMSISPLAPPRASMYVRTVWSIPVRSSFSRRVA